MDSFTGNIHAKTDAKGRVFVPASFRKILQSSEESFLVLRKDIYKDCLVLCLKSTWKEKLDDLRQQLNEWDEEEQDLYRTISALVENVELDSNGRLLISRKYLQMAKITNAVCFVGMNKFIEIWNPDQLTKAIISGEDLKSHVRKFLSNSRRTNEKPDRQINEI